MSGTEPSQVIAQERSSTASVRTRSEVDECARLRKIIEEKDAEIGTWKAVQRGVEGAHHAEIVKCKRRIEVWKHRAEEVADAEDIIRDYWKNLLVEEQAAKKKWIGATLKFQFLGKKVKDLLPDSAANDIIECFDDIEIPEVDEETREEFVVTETTDSVVATSTLAEDREYYGEDFYLNEPEAPEEPPEDESNRTTG